MDHILINTSQALAIVFPSGYADADNVLVTITRADGTTLVVNAAATKDVTVTGRYTYAPAPQSELDSLTVKWAASFGGVAQNFLTFAEIVGGHLFTVTEARSFGDMELANATTYTNEKIRAKRAEIAELFEDACGVGFFPRYGRETLDGSGTDTLSVAKGRVRRLISVTVGGVPVTGLDLAAIVAYPTGRLVRTAGWTAGNRNVVIAYEYGWPAPPGEVSGAALALARYELVNSDIADRAITLSNDLGTVRLSTPGARFPTGLPTVDSVLARYDERTFLA